MAELKDEDLIAVTNFINLMDDHEEWLFHCISEGAVMDWFGRSVLGRKSIGRFIRTQFSKMQHTIDKIQRIPPIKHRMLKHFVDDVAPSKKIVIECGQGDNCNKTTPENHIQPNVDELIKAPRKLRHKKCSTNFQEWKFVEIRCKLKLEQIENEMKHFAEKKINRIVLGYSDQINLIVYETKSHCRKKLL